MRSEISKLGPGLLFAASAVGVSHLVQSTRAGAEFGLTMALLILIACAVKYPAFRFGAEYAAATGESVIAGYARQGKWLLVFFLLAIAAEGLVVIPAVSLVTAGLTMNLLGLAANDVLVTMLIVVGCSVALAIGRYRLLEGLSKLFVLVFAVLSVVAGLASLPLLGSSGSVAAPIAANRANLDFAVAVAGWMPVGMGAAVFISLWVLARPRPADAGAAVADARFDFNVGYAATVLLALVFLVMGTALLFGRGQPLAASSDGFAAELIDLFAGAVGGWVRPVIGVAAVAVMFSTVLAVVDGFPRVYANVTRRLIAGTTAASTALDESFEASARAVSGPDAASADGSAGAAGAGHAATPAGPAPAHARGGDRLEARLYLVFLLLQALAALALLTWLLASFAVFIDFATTAGFVTAPAIAFLNHRIIQSPRVPAPLRAPAWLIAWSGVGVVVLTAASLIYLYSRIA